MEVRYRWYKNIFTNLGYDYFDENNFSYINFNDYIYTEEIITYIRPEEIMNREIRGIKYYLESEETITSQILFNNFIYHNPITISEIAIYDKSNSKYIPYTLSEDSIFEGEVFRLNDDFMSRASININENTFLLLNLDKEYQISDLEIYLYITDNKSNDTFEVSFKRNNNKVLLKKYPIKTLNPIECFPNHCKMTLIKDATWTPIYEMIKYSYKDKLYMYYKVEREYLDGYSSYAEEEYIRDSEDFKIYYRYKTTDEPEVKEVVNSSNTNEKKYNKKNDTNKIKKEVTSNIPAKEEIISNIPINEEKIELVKVDKEIHKNGIKKISIYVILGLFLIFILIIARNIYKKSRTI